MGLKIHDNIFRVTHEIFCGFLLIVIFATTADMLWTSFCIVCILKTRRPQPRPCYCIEQQGYFSLTEICNLLLFRHISYRCFSEHKAYFAVLAVLFQPNACLEVTPESLAARRGILKRLKRCGAAFFCFFLSVPDP